MKTHTTEALSRGEISDLNRFDLARPQIAWRLDVRGKAGLSEMPAPLRPGGLLPIREVERINDLATLPATVRWRVGPAQRIEPVWYVSDPDPLDHHRLDVEGQGSDRTRALQGGEQLSHMPVLAARDQIHRLLVVERLDRLAQPNRDVTGIHDPG